MSKLKETIIWIGIVIFCIIVFFSLQYFLADKDYQYAIYLTGELDKLKASLLLYDLDENEQKEIDEDIIHIENLIAAKGDPISTNNEIRNVYTKLVNMQ